MTSPLQYQYLLSVDLQSTDSRTVEVRSLTILHSYPILGLGTHPYSKESYSKNVIFVSVCLQEDEPQTLTVVLLREAGSLGFNIVGGRPCAVG